MVIVGGIVLAAAVTRPTPDTFAAYLNAQLEHAGPPATVKQGDVRGLANDISPDAYLRTVTYRNRVLWTTVEQDGRRQYVGAFSHWFKRA